MCTRMQLALSGPRKQRLELSFELLILRRSHRHVTRGGAARLSRHSVQSAVSVLRTIAILLERSDAKYGISGSSYFQVPY